MNKLLKTYKIFIVLFLICATLLTTFAFATDNDFIYTTSFARTVMRAAIGLEEKKDSYDINSDGVVTVEDSRIALRRSVNLPDYAPTTVTTTVIETTTKIEETTKPKQQIGVLSACNLSVTELQNRLKGNLKQYAATFLLAEEEYNVNAVFLAAVAALESGWGSSWLAQNKNNLFGWKAGSGFKYFNSVQEGIMFVARNLRNNYLTPGGSCFNGYEVSDIAKCYCPGGNWASQVTNIMNIIK